MASIGIGALGEPALAHVFEPILGGPLGHTAAVAVSVVIAYLLITSAQSIVGEIVPKLYTIQHAEGLARRIARPMDLDRRDRDQSRPGGQQRRPKATDDRE